MAFEKYTNSLFCCLYNRICWTSIVYPVSLLLVGNNLYFILFLTWCGINSGYLTHELQEQTLAPHFILVDILQRNTVYGDLSFQLL